jgi:hypothetical protein
LGSYGYFGPASSQISRPVTGSSRIMVSQMTLAPFEAALERAHDGPDVERENDEAEESAEFKTHGNDSFSVVSADFNARTCKELSVAPGAKGKGNHEPVNGLAARIVPCADFVRRRGLISQPTDTAFD